MSIIYFIRLKRTVTILGLIFILSSCDCVQDVYGTILDVETVSILGVLTETLKPIDSVYIYKRSHENDSGFTDTNGHFEINSIDGGLSIGCPPMTVMLQKKGYALDSIEIETGSHAKVFMRKIKK